LVMPAIKFLVLDEALPFAQFTSTLRQSFLQQAELIVYSQN
jgi:hypothetical protein